MAYAEYSRAGKPLAHQSIQTRFRGLLTAESSSRKSHSGCSHQRASKGDPLLAGAVTSALPRFVFERRGHELKKRNTFFAHKKVESILRFWFRFSAKNRPPENARTHFLLRRCIGERLQ